MTRFAVFVIFISIAFAVRSFGQSVGDALTEINEKGKSDSIEEDTDEEDRAAAVAYGLPGASGPKSSGPSLPGTEHSHQVECFVCTDCPKAEANTTSKMCPYTTDKEKQNKCVVYAEQYKHMKRPWYIRGCASERGSCDELRRAHTSHMDIVNLQFCVECEGDRCNTNDVSRSLPNFTIGFFVILVTPLLAKYTLS